MTFIKKKINSKVLGIIDIGTSKIRVAITKYKNKDFELLGYGEKRQDCDNFNIKDLNLIGDNIIESIKKAENDGKTKINDVIINIPFEEIFFEKCKINYIRKKHDKKIDKEELQEILSEIKKMCFKKSFSKIKEYNSYKKDDLKIIISNIIDIHIDKEKTKKLIGKKPKFISMFILNIFIPRVKYELIESIGEKINKNIFKIIPSEYSLSKLSFSKKNLVIIDIGKSFTSFIIKKDGHIEGVRKIAVGINYLIEEIAKKYNKTKIEIINNIDENIYLEEKESFLIIFRDILLISIEDIIKDKVCPHNFFVVGGGSNRFVRDYIKGINFNSHLIKMSNKVNFITPEIEYLNDIDSSKSNLSIYSMISSGIDFIKRQNDPIEMTLKKIMNDY